MSNRRPSLIVLTPIMPAPTGNGLAMRVHALTSAAGMDNRVHVLVLPIGGQVRTPWRDIPGVVSVRTVPQAEVDALAAAPPPADGVLACRLSTAALGVALAERLDVPLMVDADDADVAYFSERGEFELAEQWDGVARQCLPRAALVTAASDADAGWLADRYGLAGRTAVIPNSVEVPAESLRTDPPGDGRILFVANMTYAPNCEGAIWFAEQVLPQLDSRFSCDLVGAAPPALARLRSTRLRIHGWVVAPGPFYEAADVVIAPLWSGSGTRTKVLEAFARWRPVVATPRGAAAIGIVPGVHACVAETSTAFARDIEEVVKAPVWRPMVEQARELVKASYEAEAVRVATARVMSRLIGEGRQQRRAVHVEGLSAPPPAARIDLDINEVPDGLVIYDGVNDQVHYLNATAGAVFALCDGEKDTAALALELQALFGLPAPPVAETEDCLATLRSQGLLA